MVGVGVGALVGCEPSAGGLSTIAVSVTTDQLATRALERNHVSVQWLGCSGEVEETGKKGEGSPPPVTAVGVDCQGQTRDGKKIIVYGRVTGVSGDACVRGNLTAKVDGRTVFTSTVLGSCAGDASSAPAGSGGGGGPETSRPSQSSWAPQPWPSDSCSTTLPGK
ncbi:hypothetical protein AB0I22_17840 [Streptomyces sp. NPDC050610]|uniref:hypothetical protein n=1 Tax=Streptomyces sp. NPDC050610 TaxID=3157097 RepID=UPI0034206D4D